MDLGLLVEDKVAVAGPRVADASSSMMHSMEDGASAIMRFAINMT